MTRQHFIARQQAAKRNANRYGVWLMVYMFGGLIANAVGVRWVERYKSIHWLQVLFDCWVVFFILSNLPLFYLLVSRNIKRFGLRCPHCNQALTGSLPMIAVASGRCGNCGEPVFDNP